MEEKLINEDQVKNAIFKILNEETSKVKRDDFNRVQYKIEELENCVFEAVKQLRKLEDSIPDGLKTICNGRVTNISEDLEDVKNSILSLKAKIKKHKKATFSTQVEEKKK
jgi:uncharacterized protein YlzI (FlbEa/FlbD family)